MAMLEVNQLKKIYTSRFGGNSVQALKNVNFSVEKGEYVAIMGESGSGKTTLLNCISTIDRPTKGEVYLDGLETSTMTNAQRLKFRGHTLGFIFQESNLLDTLTCGENVSLPLAIAHV